MRYAPLMAALWLALQLTAPAQAEIYVEHVDLASAAGFPVNNLGPMLVRADPARNRVVVANTLSPTLTFIDGETDAVTGVDIEVRGLQHLKDEALAIRRSDGRVYLVAHRSLVVHDAGNPFAPPVPTMVQFESVAVDEASGNAFLAGRESGKLGFYDARRQRLKLLRWTDQGDALDNENQTPPPPLRKVVAIPPERPGKGGRIAAIDGFSATLTVFDGASGKPNGKRDLPLQAGGRWHLAGVDPETGYIYLVIETATRKAIQAARVHPDHADGDVVVPLPGFGEPVGMLFNAARGEVVIPYDNHATLHVIEFDDGGSLHDIAIPDFGNDATALNESGDTLYVGSWAHGNVEVIDLDQRRFVRRIEGLGILPHMFAMDWLSSNGQLYFPVGATAVNGCFGAAVTRLDPATGQAVDIRTGWGPIDLIQVPGRDDFWVFDGEGQLARVSPDGEVSFEDLPHRYPLRAAPAADGQVYLAYGPHQSYWPVVYIWAARNGVLTLDPDDGPVYDRRIPRQPLDLALDAAGALYMPQNNWGTEEAFIVSLIDGVRELSINERILLGDEVTRETTQRALRHDPDTGLLYSLKAGERDDDPSLLRVVDPQSGEVLHRLEVGANATDLLVGSDAVYVAAFGSDAVAVVSKADWTVQMIPAGKAPLKLARMGDRIFVLCHLDGSLREIGGEERAWPLPLEGTPDALFAWRGRLVVVAHSTAALTLLLLDPATGEVEEARQLYGRFGDPHFDTPNSAFHMSGQYGDAVLSLTRGKVSEADELWLADFLSGWVLIVSEI